jgi:hypothetical protein
LQFPLRGVLLKIFVFSCWIDTPAALSKLNKNQSQDKHQHLNYRLTLTPA